MLQYKQEMKYNGYTKVIKVFIYVLQLLYIRQQGISKYQQKLSYWEGGKRQQKKKSAIAIIQIQKYKNLKKKVQGRQEKKSFNKLK